MTEKPEETSAYNIPPSGNPEKVSSDSSLGKKASGNTHKQRENGQRDIASRREKRGKVSKNTAQIRPEEKTEKAFIPPPPTNELPTFIGPEFRRIDYPEKRFRTNNENKPISPGKNSSRQKQKYRGRNNKNNGASFQGKLSNPTQVVKQTSNATGAENTRFEVNQNKPLERKQNWSRTNLRQKNQPNSNKRQDRRKKQNPYPNPGGRLNADRPAPSIPIPTDRGIKLRLQRSGTSRNWWARRWIEAMERLVDPARLQRGRSYARSGQVLSIQENKTGIEAMVQGSRPQPYKVVIQVTHLNRAQWEKVIDALSEQALFTAQLLSGEMPENIESAFETAGVSLFPSRSGDLSTSCSCPDWANPCKHVAASHYILGDRFDDDPFLLFRLRGLTQEEILAGLRERRGGIQTESESPEELAIEEPGLDQMVSHFWESSESLDSFPLTISPPAVDMPMLKRLGEPAFLTDTPIQPLLKPVYDSFTRSALRAAYSEEPVEANSNDENGDKPAAL